MSKMLKPTGMVDFRASLGTAQKATSDLSELAKRVEEHQSDALVATVLSPKGQVREEAPTRDEPALDKKKPASKRAGAHNQQERLRVCSLRLSEDEWKVIQDTADSSNTTSSRLLRAIVKQWIDKQK